jgi:hypothetical protein
LIAVGDRGPLRHSVDEAELEDDDLVEPPGDEISG